MMRKTKAESYGKQIISSLHQAVAIKRGEVKPAAITRRAVTARAVSAPAAPAFSARDVKGIRSKLELSQPVFAQVLNVSPETVRAWEQGKTKPGGPAARLLEVAGVHPDWFLETVRVK